MAVHERSIRDGHPISAPWWIVSAPDVVPFVAEHGGEGDRGAARRRILVDPQTGGEEPGAHGVVVTAVTDGPDEPVIGPIVELVVGDGIGGGELMHLVGERHLGDPRPRPLPAPVARSTDGR